MGTLTAVIASIPSPGSNAIHIGPLQLRAYGLMIALGVIGASWMFGRRLEQSSTGTREDASSITMWAVVAGILGARLYHVVTSWSSDFADNPARILKIWEGGLGVPGGLLAGILVGIWRIERRGLAVSPALHAAAPAIPFAQAIGRWGNWWNQELFGRPTTLPWALKVDDAVARDAGSYPPGTTFHPTFLYESLGNFALCAALIWIGRRSAVRTGRLLAWYLAGYSALRFVVESLRIDRANEIAGLRVNTWVSLVVFTGSVIYLLATASRHRRPAALGPATGDPADALVESETDSETDSETGVLADPAGAGPVDAGTVDDVSGPDGE